MRPYNSNTAPASAKKSAKKKKRGAVQKAKVNVVKNARRISGKKTADKEEGYDLLDGSVTLTPAAKKAPKRVAQAAGKQLRKVKSIVGANNMHTKLEETPTKKPHKAVATPSKKDEEIEQAMEVTEENPTGFIRRSLSKLVTPSVNYTEIQSETEKKDTPKSSCIIS